MTFIYYAVYVIFLLISISGEYLKRPKGLRKIWLDERRGLYPLGKNISNGQKRIWIHAVSVGEVISCVPLINKLRVEQNVSITLSVITDTGRQVAFNKFPSGINIRYLPFDLPIFLNRALKIERPDIFIIIETEIWPGLITCLNQAGVPILILNGRISGKSFIGYKRLRFYLKDILSKVSYFGMQNEIYKARIIEMGAEAKRVEAIGNFKFDTVPHTETPDWFLKGQVIVAGSTHAGEEEIILRAYGQIRKKIKDLTLIIAPRHPERFKEVEALIKSMDYRFARKSEHDNPSSEPDCNIILLDTIGELAKVYGLADICILGGSFIPIGGHNLLEPASWGKPIICGQYMDNFPMTDEFVTGGATWLVDSESIVEKITSLLLDNTLRKEMGDNAKRLFDKNSGAISHAIDVINNVPQIRFF